MNNQKNQITDKPFKGRYCIAFYDEHGEELVHVFNNLKEIIIFRGEPITPKAYNFMKIGLYKALKREHHTTRMLGGKLMQVYLIDINEDEDETN